MNWYKSKLCKGVLIAIANIMLVVMVFGSLWFAMSGRMEMPMEYVLLSRETPQYEDSREFVNVLQWELWERILPMVDDAHFKETFLQLQDDDVIDIEEYLTTGKLIQGEEDSLSYTVGELKKWSKEAEQEMQNENVVVCRREDGNYVYYTSEDIRKALLEGTLIIDAESEVEVEFYIEELENGYVYQMLDADGNLLENWYFDGFVNEKHITAEGKSLIELANESLRWNGNLSQALTYMQQMLSMIDNQMRFREAVERGSVKIEDTNVSYLYVNEENKTIYTNMGEYVRYENLETHVAKIKKLGKYIDITGDGRIIQTNINALESEWDLIESHFLYATEREFDSRNRLIIGIDTSYPIEDYFYNTKMIYEEIMPYVSTVGSVMIGAAIIFLAAVIWLTVVAGRTVTKGELKLTRIDRWKTEIAIVIFGGLTAIFGVIGVEGILVMGEELARTGIVENSNLFKRAGTVLSIFITVGFTWLLMVYLSVVRRVKAKNLWKDSIIGATIGYLIRTIKSLYGASSNKTRDLLMAGGFLLLHIIAYIVPGIGFFIAFPLDCYLLAKMIYRSRGQKQIESALQKMVEGDLSFTVETQKLRGKDLEMAESVNRIKEGLTSAVEKSLKSERLKTDLITNVSHDIKTPLTSIINYVGLLKRETFDNPKIMEYLNILDIKAQRLKTLTEDVVEASKISSGNISLEYMVIDFVEMIQQTSGEFKEKFEAKGLTEVLTLPDETVPVKVDAKRIWRVVENIYNNVAKYAMPGTRVYADLTQKDGRVAFSLKNISEQQLNFSTDELTERFIRGDLARSTEGSGLGLSIAKSLTQMQGGEFEIHLDGDLFKVTLYFPKAVK